MVFPSYGRVDSSLSLSFEVNAEDQTGVPRVDIEGDLDNEVGIFPDAAENFNLTIRPDFAPGEFDDFQFNRDGVFINAATLDLVASKGESENTGSTFIEYSFIGDELNTNGIDAFSIFLTDADSDDNNGIQVVKNRNGTVLSDLDPEQPGFQFRGQSGTTRTINSLSLRRGRFRLAGGSMSSTSRDDEIIDEEGLAIFQIDPDEAVNNISYIAGEDDSSSTSPLLLANRYSLAGPSDSNPTLQVSDSGGLPVTSQRFVIEAEDLTNLDDVYRVETIGSEDDSFEVISLRESSDNGARVVTGEVSFEVGSEQADISGLPFNQALLLISTFDEGDGVGTIQVRVNDRIVPINDDGASQNFYTLNETSESGPSFPTEDIRRTAFFDLGQIEAGDEIIIQGTSNLQEFVRIDSIEFSLTSFPN